VQLFVSQLPAVYPTDRTNGGASGSSTAYALELRYGGVRYEVRALAPSGRAPVFELYRCDPVCIQQRSLSGGFGTTGNAVTVSLPREALGAPAQAALTQLRAFTTDVASSTGARIDEIVLDDVTVPARTIEVGVAAAGTPQAEVDFASVPGDGASGAFEGAVETASLPAGRYDVWARACLQPTCGATSVPVRVGPPSTTVAFTDRSVRVGQHSDTVTVEASLTDEDGGPLAGAPLTFELAGADGARTVAATTDGRGQAAAVLTLEERPGNYQLTVRYAGDGTTLAGSSVATAFVVEHEASVVDLIVDGRGANRTLTAHLRDHDAPDGAAGLGGRTVTFTAGGTTLGQAVTDNAGVARLSPPPSAKGPFRSIFGGDAWYHPSSDSVG
jgi:hypothetical protein